MDFNGLLQAGTGLLQGKTQGELYQREQERKRIEMLADQMHNTVELAKAQDLLKTGSQNRVLAANRDQRAVVDQGLRLQQAAHLGWDKPYDQFNLAERRNTLLDAQAGRDQQVGWAREDATNFAGAYEQQTGRAPGEDVALMGGRAEVLPGGTALLVPNLQSDAARRTATANAILAENNATVSTIAATKAGMLWQEEASTFFEDYNRKRSLGIFQDQADAMQAIVDRTIAELKWKIAEDSSEETYNLAVGQAIDNLRTMTAFMELKASGQVPEWMTPDDFFKQQGKLFDHDLRIDEIMASGMADAAVASVTRTSRHDSYTHADPAAVELGFAEVGARNYETDVRREGQQAGTTTGDGPGKVQTPAQEDPEEEPEDSGWGEMP